MGSKKTKVNNHTNNNKKLNKKSSQKSKFIVVAIAIAVASIGIIGFMTTSASENNNTNSSSQNLTGNWMDVHGIGIYSTADTSDNNNSLYLATHNGLFKKDIGVNSSSSSSNTSGWVEVGNDKSDLMGFTIDPANKGVMYSSGHPQTGGNLGFRISNDYGVTWQKVSDVTSPTPIDFHTMTVGNNPEIIYAASGMGDNIFISTDGGKNWTITSPPDGQQVITLAANKSNSNTLYAGTTNGLFSSIDQGKNWQEINNDIINGNDTMVTGIEVAPDGKTSYAFAVPNQPNDSGNGYIIKSMDGAKTWTKTNGQIPGAQFVSKFAFDSNGDVYVALIQDSTDTGVASSVYSSNDDGNSWTLEGTNNDKLSTKQ
ncbi:sialidase family protein [Candidatus Nitrosocosmicus hydrocola]|uniref:sialidase family protein n=1 Tax=Candidatus Nitrosocosmicus hydrocola TaxID=1826872 RepID=UPI0011E5A3AD|nr:hypothetical protein [Candidatus Nitrosocosmicus hydrocola]